MSTPHIPLFSELPLRPGDPPNSAWGLWKDRGELGSLNWLSDDLVASSAKSEIKTGERVGLNLPLDAFDPPLLGRAGFSQEIINKEPLVVNDDVITFNTQGSSQWDSLRHFAYQKQKQFYGGTTQTEIHKEPRTSINGLQSWSARCIAGRGVLIDFASWAEKNGKQIKPFEQYGIQLNDIKTIAHDAEITFQRGDILFLRTGYVDAYRSLSAEQRKEVANVKAWIGLGQSYETTEWLWERQFAAIASDSPGFECRPLLDLTYHLHPILLAGWGTPIGELFDLDALAKLCEKNQRWSFFLTSAPLNYTGAVASPPNAMAIM